MNAFNHFVERAIRWTRALSPAAKLLLILAVLVVLGLILNWAWEQDARNALR